MKNCHTILAGALSVALAIPALGQGTFQNLDFESPVLPLVPVDADNHMEITRALPNWTGYVGDAPQGHVLYNNLYLGTATVAMLVPGHAYGIVLEGSYGVALQPGLNLLGTRREGAAIAQDGLIPAWAQSIRFMASFHPLGVILVSFAGLDLPVVRLGTSEYGVAASGIAGMSGELRFTAPDLAGGANNVFLDNIRFSPTAIPEPGALALTILGTLVLAWRVRKQNV